MWFSQLALTFVAMWWDRCCGCRLTLRTSQARTPALWWPACYRSEPSGFLSLSLSHETEGVGAGLPKLTVKSFLRRYPIRPSAGSMMCGPLQRWRVQVSRPGGVLSGKNRSWCLPCPSQPCLAAALSISTITFRFGVAQGWVA